MNNKWGDVEPDKPPKVNIPLALGAVAVLLAAGIGFYYLTPVHAMLSKGTDCHDAAEYHIRRATEPGENQTANFQAGLAFLLLEEGDDLCIAWRENRSGDE